MEHSGPSVHRSDRRSAPSSHQDEARLLLDSTDRWHVLRRTLSRLGATEPEHGSQLHRDAAAVHPCAWVMVWQYPRARATNAAQILQAMHDLVGKTDDRNAVFSSAALYPLLRSLLEDAATIIWLLDESQRQERLQRLLRLLHSDAQREVEGHAALTRALIDRTPPRGTRSSTARGEALRSDAAAQLEAIAERLQLVPGANRRAPQQSEMLRGAFGDESSHLAAWRALSNLSHFSFGVHTRYGRTEESAERARLVLLSTLTFVVMDAVSSATTALERSMHAR